MIRRISNHPHGLKEADVLRIVQALIISYPDALYTDAENYPAINAKVAAVADWPGEAITSATIRSGSSTEAEECAIALALQETQ
ncbi:hypothetical protein HPB48_018538 [Haemaphysalis longicornis]|uniref:Uncharacterized protein n=1 Tax=Haemaphysalis longicornis TaxID=44386 RepID=A0A9J6G740_HAELO|nr:hypothetical protein HPB48_018538 [Haemaphysalis longicornis]